MKKLNKKQVKRLTIKLKPFWNKYQKLRSSFWNKELKLEKEMNKKLNFKCKLSFFYVDGECAGIGADDYSLRKFVPLIYDSELNEVYKK
jgi:hypothetical protein